MEMGPVVCAAKPAVSFADQKPMCQPCAAITIDDPVKRCMFNTTTCENVGPGQTCEIDCAAPFVRVGNTSMGVCAAGNSVPNRMLVWEEPTCTCPEPVPQQGYSKDSAGHWHCAQGFAGMPEIVCQPLPGCLGVQTFLRGCDKLVPCAMPSVDNCRFDVSRCTQVPPGGSCEIHCQRPLTGNHTVAVCKDLNTDPLLELEYFPLTCLLESCPDPSPWPMGYNKTPEGKWTCGNGYNGTARNRCELSDTWTSDCSAAAALTGCRPLVPCLAPTVTGTEFCALDFSACTSVDPGEQCEVHCKNPYTGAKTEAYCPQGNTNPNGLVWTRPPCILETCDEPGTIPAGFRRVNDVWECAQSYTGFAQKVCDMTENCEVRAVLQGCAQLVPCQAEQSDCRYDMYGCVSVQPGSSCRIRCQVPFAGTETTGTCLDGNTATDGLVWSPPVCTIDTCADPADGGGYQKVENVWECAPGYSGMATKTCQWAEDACEASPVLSGCVPEQPCRLPDLGDVPCMYDTSGCMNVEPGKVCSIRCQAPYIGPQTDFTCPVANTDPEMPLQGVLPVCGCAEANPIPPGYNVTRDQFENTVTYSCATGYGGVAQKVCLPGSGPECTVDPLMTGCAIPLACEAVFQDEGTGEGLARGHIHFGPALVGAAVDEANVLRYEVYWADSCEDRVEQQALGRSVSGLGDACCRTDVYRVSIDSRKPSTATGFVVYAVLESGLAPVGVYVHLNETLLDRAIISSKATTAAPALVLLFAALLMLC